MAPPAPKWRESGAFISCWEVPSGDHRDLERRLGRLPVRECAVTLVERVLSGVQLELSLVLLTLTSVQLSLANVQLSPEAPELGSLTRKRLALRRSASPLGQPVAHRSGQDHDKGDGDQAAGPQFNVHASSLDTR